MKMAASNLSLNYFGRCALSKTAIIVEHVKSAHGELMVEFEKMH